MKIGLDVSRAFLKQRTGIEEYAYQVIKHLRGKLKGHQVFLYCYKGDGKRIDFDIPENWKVKEINMDYLWTQVGLSWEMMKNPTDVLFVPAHTLPFINPKNSVVTIHGLEYEHSPESYSLYSRWFHKFFVRRSCKWTSKIIAVSENTKEDLKKYYKASDKKIKVIYNGYDRAYNTQHITYNEKKSYILFIGRIEARKNIIGIIKTFDILRRKYNYQGKLILAGKPGHGYQRIKGELSQCDCRHYVEELGFISEKDKWSLMKNADIFMFPSFSEGFGIPILEAQSVSTPVITSDRGPMNEVAGDKNILVAPKDHEKIAGLVNRVISDRIFRNEVIKKGRENVKKYSWDKCAQEVAEVLKNF